ncbi:hypothetical protein [Bacillus sp. JCM 19034]|uniref:TcaA NTF2-like domain-containing protein n=1 Tax=Bacillus sp. JCM 19034 TaxID=1481928 RepID=UPI0007831A0D|nr:hypothetical protein [Bacillus sp. JCM 19034]
MLSYIDSLVDAINYNNYSEVAPYILDNSPLEDMQIGLINRLTENGTTEEVIDREVVSIEESGNNWLVKTNETIKIIYKSGKEEVSDYTWTYTVEKVEGNYYVSNIE